jgi:hypothetical protein
LPASRVFRTIVLLLAGTLFGACSSMLPKGSALEPLPWNSFDEAMGAIDHIEAYKTTRAELRAQRIDPTTNPSIAILDYTDLLQRLPAVPAVPIDRLEHGIGDCLVAGKHCNAYAITIRQTKTRRVGNFWLDMLNFHRESVTTGWSFGALIIFVDDVVVYASGSGQPHIEVHEDSRNPLGPVQGLGSTVPLP